MGSLPARTVLLLGFALVLPGCAQTPKMTGKSPLAPAQMTPDCAVLEIFFVRFSLGDPRTGEKLWQEIDEQQIAPDCRRWLNRNGFRAGVVAGQIPIALAELLELTDKPPADNPATPEKVSEANSEPVVVQHHLQLRPRTRSEVVTSGIFDELPVMVYDRGKVGGEVYAQAQALFGAKTFPQPDGRVRLELVPELHHGPPKQRWVPSPGMLRLEAGRERRVFEEGTLEAMLSPGHMLVITALPNRPGSLGYQFFGEQCSGQWQQKLLVIRLAQTQHDGLFQTPAPASSDE